MNNNEKKICLKFPGPFEHTSTAWCTVKGSVKAGRRGLLEGSRIFSLSLGQLTTADRTEDFQVATIEYDHHNISYEISVVRVLSATPWLPYAAMFAFCATIDCVKNFNYSQSNGKRHALVNLLLKCWSWIGCISCLLCIPLYLIFTRFPMTAWSTAQSKHPGIKTILTQCARIQHI